MTDLEIVRKCAERMGYTVTDLGDNIYRVKCGEDVVGMIAECPTILRKFNPLHDDAQAMALVKKFDLCLEPNSPHFAKWAAWPINDDRENRVIAHNHDLNRAICECVARLP